MARHSGQTCSDRRRCRRRIPGLNTVSDQRASGQRPASPSASRSRYAKRSRPPFGPAKYLSTSFHVNPSGVSTVWRRQNVIFAGSRTAPPDMRPLWGELMPKGGARPGAGRPRKNLPSRISKEPLPTDAPLKCKRGRKSAQLWNGIRPKRLARDTIESRIRELARGVRGSA